MTDLVGWAATAVFAGSYFLKPRGLRLMQMVGAALWLAYGVLLGEPPIMVANALVLVAAAWTTRRTRFEIVAGNHVPPTKELPPC